MGALIGTVGDATGNNHLQDFAAAFSRGYQRRAQMELDQRHQLAQSLASIYPNANPDAQQDIAGRILQIYQTPWNKPLDKKLGDATTLGQKQFQQRAMEASGQGGQPGQPQGPTQIPAATPNGQVTQSPLISPQGTATAGGGGQITNAGPANMTQAPAIPAPPNYPGPIMSPDQRNELESKKIQAEGAAHIAAYNAGIKSIMDANPGMSPSDAAMQYRISQGGSVAGMSGLYIPHTESRNISGAEAKQSGFTTDRNGQPLNDASHYNLVNIGGRDALVPAGELGAETAQAGIEQKKAQVGELGARAKLETGRAQLLPLQAQKLVQDMQLNPERVAIAQANSIKGWFGPTTLAKDSAQYAADVQTKIDDITPLLGKLNTEGKLGPIMGRWQDFLAGKIRSGDPEISQLKVEFDVLGKAVMKMHSFRNAEQANKFISENLNVGSSFEQLLGSLSGLYTSAQSYRKMADLPPEIQEQIQNALTGGKSVTPKGGTAPGPVKNTPPPANKSSQGSGKVFHYDAQGNRVGGS